MVDLLKVSPRVAKPYNSPEIIHCTILAVKRGPIVRGKDSEPWESEILAIEAKYANGFLDLKNSTEVNYFIIRLPMQGHHRPIGPTSIATWWLDNAIAQVKTTEECESAFANS